jgi:hypothetical protein
MNIAAETIHFSERGIGGVSWRMCYKQIETVTAYLFGMAEIRTITTRWYFSRYAAPSNHGLTWNSLGVI